MTLDYETVDAVHRAVLRQLACCDDDSEAVAYLATAAPDSIVAVTDLAFKALRARINLAARPAPERAEPAGVLPPDARATEYAARLDEAHDRERRHAEPAGSASRDLSVLCPHAHQTGDLSGNWRCKDCGRWLTRAGLPVSSEPTANLPAAPPLAAPLSVLPSCDSPFVSAIPSRDSPFIDAFAPAGDGVNSDGNSYSLPPGVTLTPSFPSVFAEEPLAPPLAAPIPAQEMRETFWKVEAVRGGGYGAVVCDDKGEILRYANGNPRDLTPTYHVGDGAEAAARADGAASGLPERKP